MNVTFRLPSEELEKAFEKQATAARARRPEGPPRRRRHARLDLQRVPRKGVDALVEFMREFERTNG